MGVTMNNEIGRLMRHHCRRIPSHDDARQMVRDYKAGDVTAKERLVLGNMPLVGDMLQRCGVPSQLMDDAFDEGVIGLMLAVEKYDPDHPSQASFGTVAHWWVYQAVSRFMRLEKRRMVREGVADFVDAFQRKCQETYEQDFTDVDGPDVLPLLLTLTKRERLAMTCVTEGLTMKEVGEQMGVTRERVRQLRNKALDKLRGMVR